MRDQEGFLMDEPTWAQRVKTVRLRLHVTQKQLGERLGMPEHSIARWETRADRPWSPESEKFLKLEAEVMEEEEPS